MKIITVPHPTLHQTCDQITGVDKKLVRFIKDLEDTLRNKKNPQGVGLSAPQVDKKLRIFSTFLEHGGSKPEIRTYINPTITRTSPDKTLGPDAKKPLLEGCLSIPNIWGPVWRYKWVKLEYLVLDQTALNPGIEESRASTRDGNIPGLIKQSKRFESFPARVIQHELDHLHGILFTDYASQDGLPIYEEKNGDLVEITLSAGQL